MLKAKPRGCGRSGSKVRMWVGVWGQSLQAKGKLLRLETKAEFFPFQGSLKKIELKREMEEQKSEERTPEIQRASLPLFRAWLEMKPECFWIRIKNDKVKDIVFWWVSFYPLIIFHLHPAMAFHLGLCLTAHFILELDFTLLLHTSVAPQIQ